MSRLSLLAGGAIAVLVASGAAATATSPDRASEKVAVDAYLRYARATRAAAPAAQHNVDAYTTQVSSSCPNVLAPIEAGGPDNFDWPVLDKLFDEAHFDLDFVARRAFRAALKRFSSKAGALHWSAPAARKTIKDSLELERRALGQRQSDLCADARAVAANPDVAPPAAGAFVAAATRTANAAGLIGLERVLRRHANARQRQLLDAITSMFFEQQIELTDLDTARQQKLFAALGLATPWKMIRQDVDAESNARNMVSQVESCFTETEDYSRCRTPPNTGLPLGSGPGQVEVTDATKTSYTVVGHSRSGTDFAVRRASDGSARRTCTRPGVAQCKAGGVW